MGTLEKLRCSKVCVYILCKIGCSHHGLIAAFVLCNEHKNSLSSRGGIYELMIQHIRPEEAGDLQDSYLIVVWLTKQTWANYQFYHNKVDYKNQVSLYKFEQKGYMF